MSYKSKYDDEQAERILRSLDGEEDISLGLTKRGDILLKIVTGSNNSNWFSLALCEVVGTGGNKGQLRNVKDTKVLFCTQQSYEMPDKEFTFKVDKTYDLVKFYQLPKEFFPEYFL